MKNTWYVKNFAVVLVFTSLILVLAGCDKPDNEYSDRAAKISELSNQIAPLKVYKNSQAIATITLLQSMAWHEAHDDHDHDDTETTASAEAESHHFCLGVAIGYQAIRYATSDLFPQEVPNSSDFDIKISGSMDGVWDMLSFYTGRDLRFKGEPTKLDLESYIFTARRISKDKSLVFCLRSGLIPEKFFVLKNQGATCSHRELGKLKQQALLNILSSSPADCFELFDPTD